MAGDRPTLADVARRAGVSRTTASFIMTGRRDMRISADAEQRVRQAARELNYRPNLMARSLRTKITETLGLVSDTIATEPFAGEIVRGAVATALAHNHLLFIGETEGDREVEKRLIRDMIDRGVDGFLYAAMFTREVRPPADLRGQRVVLLNCFMPNRRTPALIPDEHAAGRAAARALLDAGHAGDIWIVGEEASDVYAARQRLAGITEALAEHGTELAGRIDCLWWPEPACAAVGKLLATGQLPKALICINDRVALGAYQALYAAGLSIPADVSIVSFDGSDLAGWIRPALTTVAIPHFEMGRRGVEMLLDPDRPDGVEKIPMPIRAGTSIGPPRA